MISSSFTLCTHEALSALIPQALVPNFFHQGPPMFTLATKILFPHSAHLGTPLCRSPPLNMCDPFLMGPAARFIWFSASFNTPLFQDTSASMPLRSKRSRAAKNTRQNAPAIFAKHAHDTASPEGSEYIISSDGSNGSVMDVESSNDSDLQVENLHMASPEGSEHIVSDSGSNCLVIDVESSDVESSDDSDTQGKEADLEDDVQSSVEALQRLYSVFLPPHLCLEEKGQEQRQKRVDRRSTYSGDSRTTCWRKDNALKRAAEGCMSLDMFIVKKVCHSSVKQWQGKHGLIPHRSANIALHHSR